MSNEKDLWESGWDLVADQEDQESAELVVQGAIQGFAAGFDLADEDARTELAASLVDEVAWALTYPQPTEADPEPLGTTEKEEAFGVRLNSLAEHLAVAYAEWSRHETGACAACGGPVTDDPAKGPSKPN